MPFSFTALTPLAYFSALVQSDDHFPLLEAASSLAQEDPEVNDVLARINGELARAPAS